MSKPKEIEGTIQAINLPIPFVLNDLVLGKTIRFTGSKAYGLVLSIGNRDFFFTKEGHLDGTGSGVTCDPDTGECEKANT